jgi:hAT family C-terminal dimerisation region
LAQRKFRRSASQFSRKSAAHGAAQSKKNDRARRERKKITRRSAKRGAISSKFRCALRLGVDLDHQPEMNKNSHKNVFLCLTMSAELKQLATNDVRLISSFAEKLLACVKVRELEILENKVVLAGWYLDKRTKVLMSQNQGLEAKSFIRMVHEKRQQLKLPTNQNEADSSIEIVQTFCSQSGLEQLIFKRVQEVSEGDANILKISKNVIEIEMKKYDELAIPNTKVKSIQFWNDVSFDFRNLSKVAFDVISAPVTEVDVERLFSHLNFIHNNLRSSLSADLLQDILFCRMNNVLSPKNA